MSEDERREYRARLNLAIVSRTIAHVASGRGPIAAAVFEAEMLIAMGLSEDEVSHELTRRAIAERNERQADDDGTD